MSFPNRCAEESEKVRTGLQNAIQFYLATANILEQIGLSDADLFPSEYTPRQIRQKNAALFPMSASQRWELFLIQTTKNTPVTQNSKLAVNRKKLKFRISRLCRSVTSKTLSFT